LIGQWLSEHLRQPFVIENRPGGGANIGVELVARAPADGYTLLLIPGSVTANATSDVTRLDINPSDGLGGLAVYLRRPYSAAATLNFLPVSWRTLGSFCQISY
jgi:Tripartite tricarboxylate transporter family receptor